MSESYAIWLLGAVVTIAVTLALGILNRLQRQGDDTNKKVTAQGEVLSGLVTSSAIEANEVSRLRENVHDLRNKVGGMMGAHDLAKEIVDAFRRP